MAKKKTSGTLVEGSRQVKATWSRTDIPVLAADAFFFSYQKEHAVMFVGNIDPIDTVAASGKTPPDEFQIVPLARFLLTPTAFKRLKDQVDDVYEGLKQRGAFDE